MAVRAVTPPGLYGQVGGPPDKIRSSPWALQVGGGALWRRAMGRRKEIKTHLKRIVVESLLIANHGSLSVHRFHKVRWGRNGSCFPAHAKVWQSLHQCQVVAWSNSGLFTFIKHV